MAPNPNGPSDPECTVIRFCRPSGSTKALLVHFTCHPTTSAENAVSGEFCGAAMTAVEEFLGPDTAAGFLQGCCGDVRPALIRDGEFFRGDHIDVKRLGSELSTVVIDALSRPMHRCRTGPCSHLTSAVPLTFEQHSAAGIPLEMTKVRFGADLGFVTFNAEIVVEYGLCVKQGSGGAALPIGYTNGMIGYVTTEQQLVEGGYESREAFQFFNMPGPFAATTERQVRHAVDRMFLV
jgi:hypothetical protein